MVRWLTVNIEAYIVRCKNCGCLQVCVYIYEEENQFVFLCIPMSITSQSIQMWTAIFEHQQTSKVPRLERVYRNIKSSQKDISTNIIMSSTDTNHTELLAKDKLQAQTCHEKLTRAEAVSRKREIMCDGLFCGNLRIWKNRCYFAVFSQQTKNIGPGTTDLMTRYETQFNTGVQKIYICLI